MVGRADVPLVVFREEIACSASVLVRTSAQVRVRDRLERRGTPVRWYLEVVKRYAVFSGRARRREFWMFTSST